MAFLKRKIAIDLGTNNFRVYLPKKGLIIDEPSLVAQERSSGKVVAVGIEAKEIYGRESGNLKLISPIKQGVIAQVNSTETLLKYALKRCGGPAYITRPEAMLSVSSSITSAETRAIVDTAKRSGIGNVNLISTPVAAALGAVLPLTEPRGYMVVDIGAGTTELAVFCLGGIVYSNTIRFGSNDINRYLLNQFRKDRGIILGKNVVEKIKTTHGFVGRSRSKKKVKITGKSKTGGPKEVEVSINDISAYLEKSISKMIDMISSSFSELPADIVSDIAESGIALTGGGANLSGLNKHIGDKTNTQCYQVANSSACVIRGAHIALAHIEQYQKSELTKIT